MLLLFFKSYEVNHICIGGVYFFLSREEKEICPYNNSHHIRRCKFSFHLVRCRRSYGPQKMVPCDFNSTHLVPEPEIYVNK
jgi:hypothetical protein